MIGNNQPIFDAFQSDLLDLFHFIDINDLKTALLFIPMIDFSKYGPFITNFLKTQQNNRETRDFRWKINCLLAKFLNVNDQNQNEQKFEFDFQPEIETEYVDDFFKSTKDQIVTFLLPFLNNQKKPKPNDYHNISFYTIVFSESYPGIFDCLYDLKIKPFLYNVVTIPKLFEVLSTDFLYILKDPPTEFLKTAPIDLIDAPLFFKSALNYQNIDFTLMLQKRLSLESQYPGIFPHIINGNFFSLLNTSFVTGESFFDIISHLVLEHLTIGEFNEIGETDMILFGLSDSIRILPYFLCGYQQLLYADLSNALTLIDFFISKNKALKQSLSTQPSNSSTSSQQSGSNLSNFVGNFKNSFQSKKSIISKSNSNLNLSEKANEYVFSEKSIELIIDILQRFKNDYEFSMFITSSSSVETNVNDLPNMSIPKHLFSLLLRKDIINHFSNKPFYLISDNDRDTDSDFIRGFHIFNIFLTNYPIPQSKIGIMKNIYDFTNDISNFLKEMKNPETRKSICIDLFSILFLRSGGRFLVSINYVRTILSVLAQHADVPFITEGLNRVSRINTKTNNDFTSLFFREPKEFFKALEDRKYQVAYDFSKSGMYSKLFLLAYSVFIIALKMQIPIEAVEFSELLNFEINLSFNEESLTAFTNSNKNKIKENIFTHLTGNSDSLIPSITTVQFDVAANFEAIMSEYSEKFGIPKEKISEVFHERGDNDCLKKIELNIADDKTIEKVKNGLANKETWQFLLEYSRSFNENCINGARLNDIFQKSPKLQDYLQYLNQYYNFCMLQPLVDPNAVFDEFNIFLPLTAIVNSGNIEKAEDFCSFLHADLFKIIVENLDKFKINQVFYDFYESKYPLEVKAMKMADKIEDNKTKKNLLEDEYFSENQIIYNIIDKIKSNEKVDYDEIGFYRIDHHNLYKLIISNNADMFQKFDKNNRYSLYYRTGSNSSKDFNSEMIDLLKMIDYVAPEEDLPMLEAIYFDHMKKMNKLSNDKSIVEYYLSVKKYDNALNYVYSNKINNDDIFDSLLSINDDPEFIDRLFIAYPKKFVKLAKHFSQHEKNFRTILKYSPIDKKREVEGFINLPKNIRDHSRIFDDESLVQAFNDYPEEILNIKKINNYFLNDDIKCLIIQGLSNSKKIKNDSGFDIISFNKYVNFLFPLFDTYSEVTKSWKKAISSWIAAINVKTPEDEQKAIKGITSIYMLTTQQEVVKDSFDNDSLLPTTAEIRAIHDFLCLHLNLRFSLEYDFKAFGASSSTYFSDYVLSICHKYDMFQLDEVMNDAFNSDIGNLALHRVRSQIQLGLIQEARRTIQFYNSLLKNKKKTRRISRKEEMRITSTEVVSRAQMKDYLLNDGAKLEKPSSNVRQLKKSHSVSMSEISEMCSKSKNNGGSILDNNNKEDDNDDNKSFYIDYFHDFMKMPPRSNDDGSNLFLNINLEHPFFSVFMHDSVFDTRFILSSFYPSDVNSPTATQSNEYSTVDENVDLSQEKIENYKNLSYNFTSYVKESIQNRRNRAKSEPSKNNNDISSLLKFQLRFYATSFSTIPSALLILNSTGNFGTAYQLLMSIQDQIKRHNYFVLHFYPATFFYSFSSPSRVITKALQNSNLRASISEGIHRNPLILTNNNGNSEVYKSRNKSPQKSSTKKDNTSPNHTNERSPSSEKAVKFVVLSDNDNVNQLKKSNTNNIVKQRPLPQSAQDPTRILTFLKSQDTESILTPGLIASLIFFLEEKHMYSLLTSLSFFANRLEDSALAAIHAFANNTNNLHYIDHAIKCISETLLIRQNKMPIPTNPDGTAQLSVFSRDETLQSITILKDKLLLQKDILNFFNEKNIPFNEEYDILNNGDDATMKCCSFLLLNYNFQIFQKIRRSMAKNFKPNILIKMLAVALSKTEESSEIDNFFGFYQTRMVHLKDSLLPCLLRELSITKNWQNILRLILIVPSPMERLYYFIEFDFVYEALGIILSPDQNKEMLAFLPYIAHRVSSLGNTELFANLSGLV